jgi:hypothetical protein
MFYCNLLPAGAKKQGTKKSLRYSYNKNSYPPILWEILIQNRAVSKFHISPFLCETKPETMGAVRHGLCRHPWQSSARSSAIIMLATSWVTPGALG